jgi:hypothetical protein
MNAHDKCVCNLGGYSIYIDIKEMHWLGVKIKE